GELDPAADGPPRAGVGRRADARNAGGQIPDREAAGHIRQQTVECVTDAAARGREPIGAGLASEPATQAGAAAANIGSVEVAFDPEHETADLVIGPECAARQPAG